jgi:carboxypeptidase family protein
VKRLTFVLTLLVAVAAIASPAVASPQTTVLEGIVVDDSGASLPGATVVLRAAAGAPIAETVTGANGAFRLEVPSGGAATIHVELSGFQPADLPIGIPARHEPITIRMKIGFGEELTVTGSRDAGVLAAASNADAVDFGPEALRRLPSDAQDLTAIVEAFTAGSPTGGVALVVDGVETDSASVPTAAIDRLVINRNPYSVEFKSPGKARVEVETVRGSRRFYHGSAATFFRNSGLQAQDAFAATKPPLTRALNEATLGGPLFAKGWSFFVAGQRLIDEGTAVVNAWTLAGPLSQNVAAPERRGTLSGRVDFRPNKADALTLKYDLFDESERNRGVGGLRLAEQGYDSVEQRHRIQVNDHRAIAGDVLNDLRFEAVASREDEGARSQTPAIVVAGAFSGGASQQFLRTHGASVQVQDAASLTIAAQPVRLGVRLKTRHSDVTDGSDAAGTYQFDSLADFSAGRPFAFVQRSGIGTAAFTTTDANVFAETTIRPAPSVSVSAGLRYDIDTRIGDWNNVAPRIAIAFAPPGTRFVLRGGVGLFYQSLPQGAVARAALFGDGGLQERTIANPAFPAADVALAGPASEWRLAGSLQQPRTLQASAAIERGFGRRSGFTAEYLRLRTSHAFRSRDVNAPATGSLVRPDPFHLNVFEIGSTGESRTDAVTVTVKGVTHNLHATTQYTLSRTIDDGSTVFELPADSATLAGEVGRADFDRRHKLNLAATYGWKKDRVRLGAVLAVSSGAPFNILTGTDTNHDLVIADRPSGFARNSGDGPAFAQLDLRFTTVFRAPRPSSADPESLKRENTDNLELTIDLFNALDRVNATSYVGVVTSPLFGEPTAARIPRTAQLSLRYRF